MQADLSNMWSRRQLKRVIITAFYRKIASRFITMWEQINVLTLLKNDEKRVGSSTLHRRMPKAPFVPNIYTTSSTQKHASKSTTDVAFLWNMGRVPWIRGRCDTVTRAWLKANRRNIWVIYAEYINCPCRERAVNTSTQQQRPSNASSVKSGFQDLNFEFSNSILGFSDSILEFSDSILETQ